MTSHGCTYASRKERKCKGVFFIQGEGKGQVESIVGLLGLACDVEVPELEQTAGRGENYWAKPNIPSHKAISGSQPIDCV